MATKKLIFGYVGGEKSVVPVDNIDQKLVEEIANTITNCETQYVLIELPTEKHDTLLINRDTFSFLYAKDDDGVKEVKYINSKSKN